jgi:hypothetical protein
VTRRSLKGRGLSATGHAGESDANPKKTLQFRNPSPESDDPVNQAKAFSSAEEKSGQKERKWTRRSDPSPSPRFGSENELASKCFALLRITREKVTVWSGVLALTNLL